MKKAELELYTDYLISTFGAATATGLSSMVDGDVSHDRVTRFLSEREYTSRDLWRQVKSTVRQIEREDGVLIFDDTIQEKAWTDENEVMCWHFDHCSGRSVRGINLLNALYYSGEVSIPVAFELVRKPLQFCDVKTRQVKRASEVTKNELMRCMIATCVNNALKFRYVLMDSWFASVENFEFIVKKKKHFIAALKDNRLVALSAADKKQGRFVRIDTLELSDKQVVRGWLKGYADEVLLVRQVFTNKDGSTGLLNLVCSDLTCNGDMIATIYQKRWKVEVFHKSLKSNAALAKSPTRRVTTQNNHVFMAIYAVFKLECLKLKHKTNHFALRAKLFIKATRQAYAELQILQAA
ncbi:IS701 family transposase [Methylobacter tundripaludum]|uniref:Transposase IS4 family protein n=1 Tax=Methylobacter tundripaludum (strain ATCC BAA-1195 / DSM 17260 / SV96) TaxID=697282 RepID=G3IRY1_METTV|nr:IS701 family transposase [Methylobacter tundripaludum]EGW21828.1 transposase IS4 family protein [Methylobacter tundripaludum SV96]EGW22192.1 transposase IS4 family protein [Methylobacter tundripaludum SV96]